MVQGQGSKVRDKMFVAEMVQMMRNLVADMRVRAQLVQDLGSKVAGKIALAVVVNQKNCSRWAETVVV